jgi:uroporphyrinogen-III synthase
VAARDGQEVSGPRSLAGARVGILQARHARELAALIERGGGEAILAPCLREARVEDREQLRAALEEIGRSPVDLFIFQTGVGTAALLALATEFGVVDALLGRVRSAVVVARGPKPLSVLLERGISVHRRTREPHTTEELIEVLDAHPLTGRLVAVQHYGSRNRSLVGFLQGRGARVIELTSYRWALPEDPRPIARFLEELGRGRVDLTAFTSASQVENLFAFTAELGLANRLPDWLNRLTVTAAIGRTTARALADHGVTMRVQPQRPKMVPFVRALAEHAASLGSRAARGPYP